MAKPLSRKVALITGASRGIGAAIGRAMVEAGARVVLTGRSAPELERLAERLSEYGDVSFRELDVIDARSVDRVVDEIAASFGRLDIVVNNAGASERSAVSAGDDGWWDRMLRVNLTGAFYVSRASLRHLREGGRIVNIASVLGVFGVGDSAGYVAAKHGLIGLTRATAAEVARRGITVNAICPGWVDTEMAENGFAAMAAATKSSVAEARAAAIAGIPSRRLLEPEEVAGLVVFLCREEARGIHGQAVRIDGGATPW